MGLQGEYLGLWDYTLFEIRITEISFEIGIMDFQIQPNWDFTDISPIRERAKDWIENGLALDSHNSLVARGSEPQTNICVNFFYGFG